MIRNTQGCTVFLLEILVTTALYKSTWSIERCSVVDVHVYSKFTIQFGEWMDFLILHKNNGGVEVIQILYNTNC